MEEIVAEYILKYPEDEIIKNYSGKISYSEFCKFLFYIKINYEEYIVDTCDTEIVDLIATKYFIETPKIKEYSQFYCVNH
jgi:hypothetical protein